MKFGNLTVEKIFGTVDDNSKFVTYIIKKIICQ